MFSCNHNYGIRLVICYKLKAISDNYCN